MVFDLYVLFSKLQRVELQSISTIKLNYRTTGGIWHACSGGSFIVFSLFFLYSLVKFKVVLLRNHAVMQLFSFGGFSDIFP